MSLRDRLETICTQLPGAVKSDPTDGELDSWKLGGKMFACLGTVDPGVSVKTRDADTAQMLIEAGVGTKAKYFHRSWIRLPDDCPEDELRHRVAASYDLIRSGLTKKAQAELPPRPEAF